MSKKYNITNDNGKNFDCYREYIELYEVLTQIYNDDSRTDMGFSDFCFGYLSPLSGTTPAADTT